MTPQEQLELEILEHIYENDQGPLNEPADLGPLCERFGEDQAHTACQILRSRGLIEAEDRLSGGYHVLPEGRVVVEQMRERRNNRSHRRAECREQLLVWLDANSDEATNKRPGTATFDGAADLLPFTRPEQDAAIKYLKDRGLVETIEAWGGPAAMWITEAGREVVDSGGVAAVERARGTGASSTTTFNVTGSGHVFATATAPGASAVANISNFDLQAAKTLATAIRAVELELELTDDDRVALSQIETAEQGTDLTLAQRATVQLYEHADKIAIGASVGIIAALAKMALGIPG